MAGHSDGGAGPRRSDGSPAGRGLATGGLAAGPRSKTLPPTRQSFQPVAGHVEEPNLLNVLAESPHKTTKELVEAARAKPGTIRVGSAGIGTVGHLGVLELEKVSGVELVKVQFGGDEGPIPSVYTREKIAAALR